MAGRSYLWYVQGTTLRPFDDFTEAAVEHIQDGSVVRTQKPTVPRAIPFNSYYWATLANIVDGTGIAPTAHHLHDALVKLCGYVSVVTDINGKPIDMVRDSTAFDRMDEPEFHDYVMHAQQILAERFGINWDDYTLANKGAA